MEVLAFISFLLGASWDFFTEVKVPGFEFSFAALFVGLFLASLGLRFVLSMLHMQLGVHSAVSTYERYPDREKRHGSADGG